MSAQILDGKLLAAKLKEDLKAQIAALKKSTGKSPRLVSLVLGSDPSSQSYALSQQRAAESLGIEYQLRTLSHSISSLDATALIEGLNEDEGVHGILINKPLPAHLDFKFLVNVILPEKDVEGMTLVNLGRLFLGKSKIVPCTPAAAMALLRSSGIDLKGKEAVVIGRSEIVGKPLALLLLEEHITPTICHSATSQAGKLEEHVRSADIVIAAIGRPLFVKGEWIKPGAVVIDVGINSVDGKIVGDVDFESAKNKASFITPVPGGVGPVTSVMLMNNALEAFKLQCQIS